MRWDAPRTQRAARCPRLLLTPLSSPLYRYHTEGFLQKNNNMLHSDLELVLKAATDPFVATMVAEAEAKLAAQQEKNPKKGGGDKGGRFASVSAHFLGQLNQLTTTLQETNAHFVRCINPNTMKKPDAFTGGHVLHQARDMLLPSPVPYPATPTSHSRLSCLSHTAAPTTSSTSSAARG